MTLKNGGEELLSLCEETMKKALKGGAEAAEAFALKSRMTGIQLERDNLKFTSFTETSGVALRVKSDGRMGFSYTNRIDAVDDLIERALSAAGHLPRSTVEFSGPGRYLPPTHFYDPKIASLDVGEGFEMAQGVVEGAKGVSRKVTLTSGGVYWGEELLAIATSEDLSRYEVSTKLGVYASAAYPYGADLISPGYDSQVVRFLPVDHSAVGRRAAEYAQGGANPKPLERVPRSVIFREEAISSLFEFLLAPSLYGERVLKGESLYSPASGVRVGDLIMSEELSIYEDPLGREGINSSTMDDEGVPTRRTSLVERGILKGYLYTLSSAEEATTGSTSSALRTGRMSTSRNYHHPPATVARRLYLEGKSVKNPVEEVEEGIYVHYILGAHTSNPSSGDFSVSASNLFYVKGGEIKYPVKPLMLAGNMRRLMESITLLGSERKEVPGSLTAVGISTPVVVAEGIGIIT